jgi:hypothetical protein
MSSQRDLPLSMVTLVFGVLSIPLAFLRHLCVPAAIMGLLALAFHAWGRWRAARGGAYSAGSLRRSWWGGRLAAVGTICAMAMWILWWTDVLLR